ncbi:hypothetical protein J7K42_00955 [bacterium]|nr:hypothetical protein [bacterium]
MKKFLILILFFYFLLIFQESFLSHFTLFGRTPNLILIAVFLLLFFEDSTPLTPPFHPSLRSGWVPHFRLENLGISAGFLAGTISDLFSHFPFGIFAFNLTLSVFLAKRISKFFKKSNILAFSLLFLGYFSFYKALLIFENFLSLLFFKKNLGFSTTVPWGLGLSSFFSEISLSFLVIFLVLLLTKKYEIFFQK